LCWILSSKNGEAAIFRKAMLIYKPESLELLRQRIDLVEVVSSYVPLKKAGGSYKGCCPFHEEKTPSFVIQRGDTHYHCYGCGAHGDAISFLMGHLKLSFVEAIESLAERFQVSLEKVEQGKEQKGPNKAALKKTLERASEIYHFSLLFTEEGHHALQYLYARGITLQFIYQFQVGFAPKDGAFLYQLLKAEGNPEELLEEAGLLARGKRRDFFIDRITFPIRDAIGAVIGFSARKFKEETFGGKYINTSETLLFKKSHVLFGLSYARQQITKERKVIIVEGQIDALRLIHCGFTCTVAGQGTAFGEDHVKELLQLGVKQVFLALDGDDAGREAAVKIGNLFQKKGVAVSVLSFSEGIDPDTFLRERGPEAFSHLLEKAGEYISFLVSHFSRTFDVATPAGKNELVQTIAQLIRGWEQPLMIHESLRLLAELVHVPESMVGVEGVTSLYVKKNEKAHFAEVDARRILEVDLLRWLFLAGTHEERIVEIVRMNARAEHFRNPVCERLFTLYLEAYEKRSARDFLSIAIASSHSEDQDFFSELMQKKINLKRAENGVVETLQKFLECHWMEEGEKITDEIKNRSLTEEQHLALLKQFDAMKKTMPKVILP
jgi:DNA primase